MLTVDLAALDLEPDQRILDLGCGGGRHIHALYYAGKYEVVGVDLSLADVVRTRRGFEAYPDLESPHERLIVLAVADALRLPFADATFDRIVCSEVLEHIVPYERALGEIARILKPDGILAVSVPRYWPEWLCWRLARGYHETPGGHVRIFRPRELARAVERNGFARLKAHFAHALHSPYWWLQCALWERRETSPLVAAYRKLLEWDILQRPWPTRALERLLNPVMGKSLVVYFRKEASA
ncbi:MAG: class I SAM-dependent methyltransferase [Alphaproteobacteria bacterium]|nr:class I SAM-dependent methyltransferase [Alphaproteobacteria bacterium]